MLRLIRWMLLIAVLVVPLGYLLAHDFASQPMGARFCSLVGASKCHSLTSGMREAEQAIEAKLKFLESLKAGAHAHPSAKTSNSTPITVTTQAGPEAPPLDQHSPRERQALDKILAQRGSR